MERMTILIAIIDAQLTMLKEKMSKARRKVCSDLFVSESGAYKPWWGYPRPLFAKILLRANVVWLA